MIKNILFDVGGTLIDSDSWKRTADEETYRIARSMGFEMNRKEFDTAWGRALGEYDKEKGKNPNLHGGITFSLKAIFRTLGIDIAPSRLEEMKRRLEEYRVKNSTMLDGSDIVLKNLHRRYKLYAVSRGEGRVMRMLLSYHKLDKFFDNIFISEEANADKKSGKLYEYVLVTMKLIPNECLMIGNEIVADGKCMDFGIDFCFVDRGGTDARDGYTLKVRNLNEIEGIINGR